MGVTSGGPGALVGIDPTALSGSIIDDLVTIEDLELPHPAFRTVASACAYLQDLEVGDHGSWSALLVNVDEFDLPELESVLSAATALGPQAVILSVYRHRLDAARTDWALRAGGLGMRVSPDPHHNVAILSRLTLGRAPRSSTVAPTPTPPFASLRPVFLVHSSDDKARVHELYQQLTGDGIRCWLDDFELIAGQNWEAAIRSALRTSSHVLICLSPAFTGRAGFAQAELTYALDFARQHPEGSNYLVPVRLEPCELPERLRHLHSVDLFGSTGYQDLLRALG